MNQVILDILRAVATRKETAGTRILAGKIVAAHDARASKAPPASVAHHARVRRAEERAQEETRAETWALVLDRTAIDHLGRHACEACHRLGALEPHHLVLVARTNDPRWVLALCADCHRLGPLSAHRSPRRFAQTIVVPWAAAHGVELPPRKEYR